MATMTHSVLKLSADQSPAGRPSLAERVKAMPISDLRNELRKRRSGSSVERQAAQEEQIRARAMSASARLESLS